MKNQIPPEKTKDMVEFPTMKPQERFKSILNGLNTVLSYGQSEYVRDFGMSVETASEPLSITARVLQPPNLRYGQGSKQPTIQPRDGAWNMMDKKLYEAENHQDKRREIWLLALSMLAELSVSTLSSLEKSSQLMTIACPRCSSDYKMGESSVKGGGFQQLRAAGSEATKKAKEGFSGGPSLIIVVLPDGGNEFYSAVKDTDPKNPTIVMDVIRPAPGSQGRPSFTSVVGNIDSDNAKYIATMRVQPSKQEI
ncbi:hypothetical protein C0995_003091 [Termitomyces sp. Mi166|nr:hypothetical protein C0995_003091 [Termitomyces sp. Mi166\